MARTGENIYKRKDGRWEARYIFTRDKTGKPRYKSLYGKTYADVKQKLTKAAVESLVQQEIENTPNILLEKLAADYLEHTRRAIKESTYVQYIDLL